MSRCNAPISLPETSPARLRQRTHLDAGRAGRAAIRFAGAAAAAATATNTSLVVSLYRSESKTANPGNLIAGELASRRNAQLFRVDA